MDKVKRIPNLFGIDGYALPEEFRRFKTQRPPEPKEYFKSLLDQRIEELKGEQNGRS